MSSSICQYMPWQSANKHIEVKVDPMVVRCLDINSSICFINNSSNFSAFGLFNYQSLLYIFAINDLNNYELATGLEPLMFSAIYCN